MISRRYAEALPEFRKAVALDPNAGFPCWSLGMALEETGAYEEAIATFERGVEITQGNHSLYIGLLGSAFARAGRRATPSASWPSWRSARPASTCRPSTRRWSSPRSAGPTRP